MNKLVNPFSMKTIPVVKYLGESKVVYDAEGNVECVNVDSFSVDAQNWVHINRSSKVRRMIAKLPTASKSLFLLLPLCLNSDYEYVIFTKEKYLEIHNQDLPEDEEPTTLSDKSFKAGINGLIQHGFLDWKDKAAGHFWINHEIFHYGSRVRMFPNNLLVVKTIQKDAVIRTRENQV